LADESKE
jgi:hypothetical protein